MALGGTVTLDSFSESASAWIITPKQPVQQTLDGAYGTPAVNDVVMRNRTTGLYTKLDASADNSGLDCVGIVYDIPDMVNGLRVILAKDGMVQTDLLNITSYATNEVAAKLVISSGLSQLVTN